MKSATFLLRWSLILAIGAATPAARGQEAPVPPPPTPGQIDQPAGAAPVSETGPPAETPAEAEVLTRGPIHEAFAEPVVFNPQSGPVVPRIPPNPVEEMPPDQKPEGRNVTWIAGYWAWDDDRDDFLWVSGIWRDLPPGRQWVPGYWNQRDQGAQWVAGYWAPTAQDEARYLPNAPPQSLEVGPNTPAPDPRSTWAPGHWAWVEERYVWTPGCWIPIRTDWVWVPARYVWTPAGYVFVEGYWDYALSQRGQIFAPVYFPPTLIVQPAFVYTPSVVIQNTVVVDHFFCRPAWNHYYFGDYYAPAYRQSGFHFALGFGSNGWGGSGFSFGLGVQRGLGGFYNPVVAQYAAVQSLTDVTYIQRVEQVYRHRVAIVDARPPRTFLPQQPGNAGFATSLADVAHARADLVGARADMIAARSDMTQSRSQAVQARNDARLSRWETLNQTQRAELARRADSLKDLRAARLDRESKLASAHIAAQAEARTERTRAIVEARAAARSASLPRSPIADASTALPGPRPGIPALANRPSALQPLPRGGSPAGATTADSNPLRRADSSPLRRPERPGGNLAWTTRPGLDTERPQPLGDATAPGRLPGNRNLPARPSANPTVNPLMPDQSPRSGPRPQAGAPFATPRPTGPAGMARNRPALTPRNTPGNRPEPRRAGQSRPNRGQSPD